MCCSTIRTCSETPARGADAAACPRPPLLLVIVRHTLRRKGVDDRELADYLSAVLMTSVSGTGRGASTGTTTSSITTWSTFSRISRPRAVTVASASCAPRQLRPLARRDIPGLHRRAPGAAGRPRCHLLRVTRQPGVRTRLGSCPGRIIGTRTDPAAGGWPLPGGSRSALNGGERPGLFPASVGQPADRATVRGSNLLQ